MSRDNKLRCLGTYTMYEDVHLSRNYRCTTLNMLRLKWWQCEWEWHGIMGWCFLFKNSRFNDDHIPVRILGGVGWVGIRTITYIMFIGFQQYLGNILFRSKLGIGYRHYASLNMRIIANQMTSAFKACSLELLLSVRQGFLGRHYISV